MDANALTSSGVAMERPGTPRKKSQRGVETGPRSSLKKNLNKNKFALEKINGSWRKIPGPQISPEKNPGGGLKKIAWGLKK